MNFDFRHLINKKQEQVKKTILLWNSKDKEKTTS